MILQKTLIYCLLITALTGFFLRDTLAIPPNRAFMMERLTKMKKEVTSMRVVSEIQIFEDETGSKYKSVNELLTLERTPEGVRIMSQLFAPNSKKAFLIRVWDQGKKEGQLWLPGKNSPLNFTNPGLATQILFQDQSSLLKEYLGMRGFEIPEEKDLVQDAHFKRVKRCNEIEILNAYRAKNKIPAPEKTPEEQAEESAELLALDCETLKAEQTAKIEEAKKARLAEIYKLPPEKREAELKKPKPMEELSLPPIPVKDFYKREEFKLRPVRGRVAVVIPDREKKNHIWLDSMNFTPVKIQFKAMGVYNSDYMEVDFFDDGFYKGGFIYPRTLLVKMDGQSVARVILRNIDLSPTFKGDQPKLINPSSGLTMLDSPLAGSETSTVVKLTEAIR
jgi:hypothetical protein